MRVFSIRFLTWGVLGKTRHPTQKHTTLQTHYTSASFSYTQLPPIQCSIYPLSSVLLSFHIHFFLSRYQDFFHCITFTMIFISASEVLGYHEQCSLNMLQVGNNHTGDHRVGPGTHIPCENKHTAWVKMSTKATCVGDKEHTQ